MNWGSVFFWKMYEWIEWHTNELGFNFFLGEDIRKWIGRHTNELGFRFFFGRYTNELWKTYEWIGAQIFLLEDIRMNWKTYEWIGVRAGHARANSREEEICLKVIRRGLAVDMPEQIPGKKKSDSKCFRRVWRWTCQGKPLGSRNHAESAPAGFGGGHARANPREAEIWHVHFEPDFFFPGVCSGMSTPKPRRSTLSLISASRGFALACPACPPPNPAEALSAWFRLPGVCSGMSTAKPRRSTFSLISASRGFAPACPRPNPAEALSAWFLLPGGLLWHVHRQTPPKHFEHLWAWFLLPGGLLWHVRRQTPPKHFRPDFFFPGVCSGISTSKPRRRTFSLISASRGFALACPPPNPAEALSAWFLLPGGLLWHVHLQTLPAEALSAWFLLRGGLLWHVHPQTPTKHFQPDFFFAGACSGMSTPKPRRSTFSHSQIGNLAVPYMLWTGLRITSWITDSTLWGFWYTDSGITD